MPLCHLNDQTVSLELASFLLPWMHPRPPVSIATRLKRLYRPCTAFPCIRHCSSTTTRVLPIDSDMVYPTNPSLATDLLSALPDKFQQARQSGQLFYFPSEAKDVYSNGKRFNLRICPALQDKAKAKREALAAARAAAQDSSPDHKRARKADSSKADEVEHEHEHEHEHVDKQNSAEPFKPPYVPELYLGCLEGIEGEKGMSILLNKYAVLPEHMLLCPPEYEPQDLPPSPHQLALAYLVLVAAARHPTRPRRLLAFYNGGQGAGASQKWRHLQFIELQGRAPVEEWVDGVQFGNDSEPVLHPDLPHVHIIHPVSRLKNIPYPPTEDQCVQLVDELAPAFMKSLDLAVQSVRKADGKPDGGWNLLMTLDHIHLIPRSSPTFNVGDPHEPVELNSLGYAGMMLVRSPDEEKILMDTAEQQGGLATILEKCGVPRKYGEQAIESLKAHIAGGPGPF